jgi:protein-tyrosine phosphatase
MNVLVHCQAGLNRSSLVVAEYLIRYEGLTGPKAVQMIRESRSQVCLCNPDFDRWVCARA